MASLVIFANVSLLSLATIVRLPVLLPHPVDLIPVPMVERASMLKTVPLQHTSVDARHFSQMLIAPPMSDQIHAHRLAANTEVLAYSILTYSPVNARLTTVGPLVPITLAPIHAIQILVRMAVHAVMWMQNTVVAALPIGKDPPAWPTQVPILATPIRATGMSIVPQF
jgi:hypothetical protein